MGGVGVHRELKQDRGQLMRMCDPIHRHHEPRSSDSVLISGRHADGFSDWPAFGSPGVCFTAPLGPWLVPLWGMLSLPVSVKAKLCTGWEGSAAYWGGPDSSTTDRLLFYKPRNRSSEELKGFSQHEK